MSITAVNALLAQVAQLCEAPDSAFTFELAELPREESIELSLAPRFAGVHWKTKQPYSISDWDLKAEPRGDDLFGILGPVLGSWLFGMPSSLSHIQEHVRTAIVGQLCDHISGIVGHCSVHEIFVTPPVWYETSWQDFVLLSPERLWFLHFGVTD